MTEKPGTKNSFCIDILRIQMQNKRGLECACQCLLAVWFFYDCLFFSDVNVLQARFEFGQSSFRRPAGNLENTTAAASAL